jgi:hypothetical protein
MASIICVLFKNTDTRLNFRVDGKELVADYSIQSKTSGVSGVAIKAIDGDERYLKMRIKIAGKDRISIVYRGKLRINYKKADAIQDMQRRGQPSQELAKNAAKIPDYDGELTCVSDPSKIFSLKGYKIDTDFKTGKPLEPKNKFIKVWLD